MSKLVQIDKVFWLHVGRNPIKQIYWFTIV